MMRLENMIDGASGTLRRSVTGAQRGSRLSLCLFEEGKHVLERLREDVHRRPDRRSELAGPRRPLAESSNVSVVGCHVLLHPASTELQRPEFDPSLLRGIEHLLSPGKCGAHVLALTTRWADWHAVLGSTAVQEGPRSRAATEVLAKGRDTVGASPSRTVRRRTHHHVPHDPDAWGLRDARS